VTNDKLVYDLHEWAPGALRGFPEGTSKEEIARHEALALEALVAAGKITKADRTQVIFIVNFIATPRFDENDAWPHTFQLTLSVPWGPRRQLCQ
jgi:hypothetical protein